MGNHHDNHHSEGQKPVSFTVPFILATVTIIAMLLLLSLCDPGHHKCECKEDCSKECMEACEKNDHSHHDAHGNEVKSTTNAHNEEHAATPATDTTKAESHDHAADTTHKEHAH